MAITDIYTPVSVPEPEVGTELLGLEFNYYEEVADVDRAVEAGNLPPAEALRIIDSLEAAPSQAAAADTIAAEVHKGLASSDRRQIHAGRCACHACFLA